MKKNHIIIYSVLSFIKLFTASIHLQREEDPTIILKLIPSLKNIFIGSDNALDMYETKYLWYRKHLFIEVLHLNTKSDIIYQLIVMLWWVATLLLILYFIKKQFKKNNS